MIITEAQVFASDTMVFWVYGGKTLATAAALWFCFKGRWRQEILGRFDWRAVVLGLVVLVIWIAGSDIISHDHEVRFDPTVFSSLPATVFAILIRAVGASLVVPIKEELVWRSFLMRYIIKVDFMSEPLGTYTHYSFWGTIVAFTVVHQVWEWPVTIATGILYGLYLVKTKNLIGCIIAHATTNLGLAIYVVYTQKWYFW
jgi:CAAX prenyl protease-like protein